MSQTVCRGHDRQHDTATDRAFQTDQVSQKRSSKLAGLALLWCGHAGPDGIMFIFDGGQLDKDQAAALKPTDDELKGLRFLAYDDAVPLLRTSMARRVRAALDALDNDRPHYAEFGRSQ
ncbi:hypothetical protein AB0D32_20045 [Micromonospora sp. NPDC048170]|uniref:hypothetical protein n=1 Tax=Micromonospora sp. NPDC048170 TaxID=3154819 RepID=UPI0033D1B643